MSHLDVDIFEFLILTLIPVAALFIIEMICRAVKVKSWPKLTVQGIKQDEQKSIQKNLFTNCILILNQTFRAFF